jgi:hypothetical protein
MAVGLPTNPRLAVAIQDAALTSALPDVRPPSQKIGATRGSHPSPQNTGHWNGSNTVNNHV